MEKEPPCRKSNTSRCVRKATYNPTLPRDACDSYLILGRLQFPLLCPPRQLLHFIRYARQPFPIRILDNRRDKPLLNSNRDRNVDGVVFSDAGLVPARVDLGEFAEGEGRGFDDKVVYGEFVFVGGLGVEDFSESVGFIFDEAGSATLENHVCVRANNERPTSTPDPSQPPWSNKSAESDSWTLSTSSQSPSSYSSTARPHTVPRVFVSVPSVLPRQKEQEPRECSSGCRV